MNLKNKRLRKGRCILLSVIVLFICVLFNNAQGEADAADYSQVNQLQKIVVSNNDSLWSLVSENCSFDQDIRKAIYEVKKINGLTTSIIHPGQIIYIPYTLAD